MLRFGRLPLDVDGPSGMVRAFWSQLAMLVLEEVTETGIADMAFDGCPAASTTSILTIPLSFLA